MQLELSFTSKELAMSTQVSILLPDNSAKKEAAPCKTLWLLHGLSGDHTAWCRYTSIERYAREYNLAVVMPRVDRSWYTNTAYGANYFNYVARELPDLCRNTFRCMSEKREDNIVAGLSMGGYGALKLALSFPEQYGSCISLSGSLDITRKNRPYRLEEWRGIFGFDMASADALEGSEHDLFALCRNLKKSGGEFPKTYLWCGLEDSLITVNRDFDALLTDLGVAHYFGESEGDHSWKWWDLHIQNALRWALETQE